MTTLRWNPRPLVAAVGLGWVCAVLGCTGPAPERPSGPLSTETITVYSGRGEELVAPLIERFEKASGITVQVRYGETAQLAALLREEGANSPCDVFFAQDAGGLGAVAEMLVSLPEGVRERVEARFQGTDGTWVGVSGRARVVAYNTQRVKPEDLPKSIVGFTEPAWKGRIGWPPTNGSFQAFITGFRKAEGDAAAKAWLTSIQAHVPKTFRNNNAAVLAVSTGEVDVAFVNHYYLFRFLAERGEDFPVANFYLQGGDPGALINVAGVGVLKTSKKSQAATQFVEFLLSDEAQAYFANETFEYPLVAGVPIDDRLVPLENIATPLFDLSDLSDLQGTLQMLRETEVVY